MRKSIIIGIVAITLVIPSCSNRAVEYYGKKYAEDAEAALRMEQLSDTDPAVREKALYRLCEVGERNDEMLAELIRLAESDESDEVRIAAFTALGRFGSDQPGAWETGMNAMEDDSEAVREAASLCAAIFARQGYGIVPPFEEWLKDPSPRIRKNALHGFRLYYRKDERPDEVTNAIIGALSDEDPEVGMTAAHTLADWGIEPEKTTALYIEMLRNPLEASSAVYNLGTMEPPPVEAIPRLLELFYNPGASIDIEELVGDGRTVPEIERELKDRYPESYLYAKLVRDKPDRIELGKSSSSDNPIVYFTWNNGKEELIHDGDLEGVPPSVALDSAAKIDVNEDVLAAMMVGLSDKSSHIRRSALNTVSFHNASTLPLLPRLIEMAQSDPDLNTRKDALLDLGYYAKRAAEMVIPILLKALDDETTRDAALKGISVAGSAASKAIPILKAMDAAENDESEFDYATSKHAGLIISLELESGKGLPFIAELLKSKNERIRRIAADELDEFGEDGIRYAVESLKDEASDVRKAAAMSLQIIGREYPAAIPYMVEALKDEDITVVYWTLGFFDLDRNRHELPIEAIPILIGILYEVNLSTGRIERLGIGIYQQGEAMVLPRSSVRALGALGPAASDAVPALARLLGSDDMELCYYAFTALGQIGAASVKALPELRAALVSESQQKRAMAAHVIGLLGPDARDAVGDLIKLLSDENPGVRREAATSLGLIGLNSGEVLKALKDSARNDRNIVVREAAGMAIKALST